MLSLTLTCSAARAAKDNASYFSFYLEEGGGVLALVFPGIVENRGMGVDVW